MKQNVNATFNLNMRTFPLRIEFDAKTVFNARLSRNDWSDLSTWPAAVLVVTVHTRTLMNDEFTIKN
jgi:hypothetical protein